MPGILRLARGRDGNGGAPSSAARWHLLAHWPRLHAPPLEYTPEELARLLSNLEEVTSPHDWPAKLAEALHENRANYRLMVLWLDQQGAAHGWRTAGMVHHDHDSLHASSPGLS